MTDGESSGVNDDLGDVQAPPKGSGDDRNAGMMGCGGMVCSCGAAEQGRSTGNRAERKRGETGGEIAWGSESMAGAETEPRRNLIGKRPAANVHQRRPVGFRMCASGGGRILCSRRNSAGFGWLNGRRRSHPLMPGDPQYLLKEKEEKLDTPVEPVEDDASKTTENTLSEEVAPKADESPAVESSVAVEESSVASDAPAVVSDEPSATEAASEESSPSTEDDTSGGQETTDEAADVKLETAPADFRFPTTNQTRHCFTRYVEYHRCIAAKGEGASECDKFAKYYRSLCPGEWVDRWNEQRENGTFPGPI
nr:cytochrome C oxidase subunit 6B-1-like [Ipomoea batatas]